MVGVQVVDIEERVWSPRYGLKGMIDVSMRVATSGQGNSGSALMPFELKTGKKTTGYVKGPSSPLPPLFRLCRGSSVLQRSRQDRWCAVPSKLPGVSPVGLSGASSPYPEVCLWSCRAWWSTVPRSSCTRCSWRTGQPRGLPAARAPLPSWHAKLSLSKLYDLLSCLPVFSLRWRLLFGRGA